jgi:preprotein translocase subunit SecF
VRLLRLVPDETKFDFMRFRRISFPLSAILSVLAIVIYFTVGLNFGIDFIGGTLMEVQSKSGPADLAKMRTDLNALQLGDVQLQQFGPSRSSRAARRRSSRRSPRCGRCWAMRSNTAASRWSARACRASS